MIYLELIIYAIPAIFAAVAHMFIVKLNVWRFLAVPMDHKCTYRGRRIFGKNKTYRGLVVMVVFSIIGVFLLEYLENSVPVIREFNPIDLDMFWWEKVLLGILFGAAYILGELPNSFVKRQKGIPEGKSGGVVHTLVDMGESPVACMLLTWPLTKISFVFILHGFYFFILVHLVINLMLFALGVRKNPL